MSVRDRQGACRVLMVEDHADTAFVMARLLEKLGYAVETAGSAAEARAKIVTSLAYLFRAIDGAPTAARLSPADPGARASPAPAQRPLARRVASRQA